MKSRTLSAEEIVANSKAKLERDTANMGESFWRREAARVRGELDSARLEVTIRSQGQ